MLYLFPIGLPLRRGNGSNDTVFSPVLRYGLHTLTLVRPTSKVVSDVTQPGNPSGDACMYEPVGIMITSTFGRTSDTSKKATEQIATLPLEYLIAVVSEWICCNIAHEPCARAVVLGVPIK